MSQPIISNHGRANNKAATRQRMEEMSKPAVLQARASRYASWRSIFIYTVLIGNTIGIASLVAALKPDLLSDHAYTLCVTMIDIEILLIFLLAFFLEYSDGRLTRPLYEKATSIWEDLATQDPLTGLPNRLAFMRALDEELAVAKKTKTQCAVFFIDLNKFKQINDTYGHAAGDEVISIAAQRIYQSITPRDLAARLGGDEFAVLLRNVTIGQAQKVADDIENLVRKPMDVGDKMLIVGASIGIRISDAKSSGAEEMLHDADVKMYKAKAATRWQKAHINKGVQTPGRNPGKI